MKRLSDTKSVEYAIECIRRLATKKPIPEDVFLDKLKTLAKEENIILKHSDILGAIWQCIDGDCIKIENDCVVAVIPKNANMYYGMRMQDALRQMSKTYIKKPDCKDLLEQVAKALDKENVKYVC